MRIWNINSIFIDFIQLLNIKKLIFVNYLSLIVIFYFSIFMSNFEFYFFLVFNIKNNNINDNNNIIDKPNIIIDILLFHIFYYFYISI